MLNKARRSMLLGASALAGVFGRSGSTTAAAPAPAGAAGHALPGLMELDDYAALRAYRGDQRQATIAGDASGRASSGIAGIFVRDDADTVTPDNGGTVIVAVGGERWKRAFSGAASVTWFGARNDGSASADDALMRAQAWCGATRELCWPAGTYAFTRPVAITDGAHWTASGAVTLSFSGLGAQSDCLRISGGAAYGRTVLHDFTVDCRATGRDGVVLLNGDHCSIRVRVKNAQRDGFAVFCSGSDWVENARLDIFTEANGRHAMRIEMAGSAGAFFNESILRLEARGVSLRYHGGNGLLALCPGSGAGSKVASLHIEAINLDAQRGAAAANGFDIGRNPIRLAYTAGGTNKYEAWRIEGGGFETTTGSDDFRSPYLVYAEPGVKAPYWDIRGIVPFNWSTGAGVSGLTDYTFHSCKDGGGLSTSNVAGGSSLIGAFGARSTVDIDIPIPDLPDNGNYGSKIVSAIYELVLSYQQSATAGQEMHVRRVEISFNKAGAGTHWVSSVAVASNIGTMIASVNGITIADAHLRVNLTTGGGFGGADNHIHASLVRLAVGRL